MKKWAWLLSAAAVVTAVFLGIRVWTHSPAAPRTEAEIIYDLVQGYELTASVNSRLLDELEQANRDTGGKWREIMERWQAADSDMPVNRGILPDGLEEDGKLCIIVLGFQLNPDGSMQQELIGRLECAKRSAEKYPQAYILCTGGGTAASSDATEAEAMAAWLEENGISRERILVEARSISTSENAIYSCKLLSEQYPQVTQAAIISSDYHLPWAEILFETQFILGGGSINVASNAAYPTATTLSGFSLRRYQANGILDIAFR